MTDKTDLMRNHTEAYILHGVHRTNADKRNDVKFALLHPNGCYLSNRQIARHVGVDNKTVAVIRRELEASGEICHTDTREGLDGKQHPARQKDRNQKSNPQPTRFFNGHEN